MKEKYKMFLNKHDFKLLQRIYGTLRVAHWLLLLAVVVMLGLYVYATELSDLVLAFLFFLLLLLIFTVRRPLQKRIKELASIEKAISDLYYFMDSTLGGNRPDTLDYPGPPSLRGVIKTGTYTDDNKGATFTVRLEGGAIRLNWEIWLDMIIDPDKPHRPISASNLDVVRDIYGYLSSGKVLGDDARSKPGLRVSGRTEM